MSMACADGAFVSASRVVRLECSKCGTVTTTAHPQNDREIDELMLDHAREKHGGTWRAAQLGLRHG